MNLQLFFYSNLSTSHWEFIIQFRFCSLTTICSGNFYSLYLPIAPILGQQLALGPQMPDKVLDFASYFIYILTMAEFLMTEL